MASAFDSDDVAPLLSAGNRSEAASAAPFPDIVTGPSAHTLSGVLSEHGTTIPAETWIDAPGRFETPEPTAGQRSSCDLATATGCGAAGGARESAVGHMDVHDIQEPAVAAADAAPPTMTEPTTSEPTTPQPTAVERRGVNVLEQILWECEQAEPTGALAHAGSLTDVRRGSADPVGLLAKLRVACSDEELRNAGLLVSDAGTNCLHPDLASPTCLWLPLRDAAGSIYEIIGESGGRRTRQPAVASIQFDQTFCAAVQATGIAVVVCSLWDMVFLRSLGIAAVIGSDLARTPIDPAERLPFMINRGLNKAKNPFPENEVQWVLLVAGSLATSDLTEPPELEAVKDHFRLRKHQLGYPDAEAYVWQPQSEELAALHWLAKNGDQPGITHLIEDALDSAPPLIEPPPPPPPPPPKSLAENLAAWLLAAEPEPFLAGKLTRELSRQSYDLFCDPLFRAALDCPDPEEAALKYHFALRSCELQRRSMQRLRDPQSVPSKAEAAIEHQQLQDLLQIKKALQPADQPPSARSRTIILPGKASPVPHLPSYRRSDQP